MCAWSLSLAVLSFTARVDRGRREPDDELTTALISSYHRSHEHISAVAVPAHNCAVYYVQTLLVSATYQLSVTQAVGGRPMKSAMAVVDWYGPYTLDDARTAASDFCDGLYMAIGKRPYQRTVQLQYIGLASNLSIRLRNHHHKLSQITRQKEVWLGEIATPRRSGPKIKATDQMLDLVEWAHIYFLQLPPNDKKREQPPDYPITVYNRWWREDYSTAHDRRPNKQWPDLIDFLDSESPAKVVWFGKSPIVQPVVEFAT